MTYIYSVFLMLQKYIYSVKMASKNYIYSVRMAKYLSNYARVRAALLSPENLRPFIPFSASRRVVSL